MNIQEFEEIVSPGDIVFITINKGDRFIKNTVKIGVFRSIKNNYVYIGDTMSLYGEISTTSTIFLDSICDVKIVMKKEDVAKNIVESVDLCHVFL